MSSLSAVTRLPNSNDIKVYRRPPSQLSQELDSTEPVSKAGEPHEVFKSSSFTAHVMNMPDFSTRARREDGDDDAYDRVDMSFRATGNTDAAEDFDEDPDSDVDWEVEGPAEARREEPRKMLQPQPQSQGFPLVAPSSAIKNIPYEPLRPVLPACTLYLAFSSPNVKTEERFVGVALLLTPGTPDTKSRARDAVRYYAHRTQAAAPFQFIVERVPARLPSLECVLRLGKINSETSEQLELYLQAAALRENGCIIQNEDWVARAVEHLKTIRVIHVKGVEDGGAKALIRQGFKLCKKQGQKFSESPIDRPFAPPLDRAVPTYNARGLQISSELGPLEGDVWHGL